MTRASTSAKSNSRRALTLIWVALSIPVLFGFAAFAIDIGMMRFWRTHCQGAADAASRAAAQAMIETDGDLTAAELEAIHYAELNMPGEGTVLASSDVVFGRWNRLSRTFTPTESAPNAVQVIVRRSTANGNPLPLIFAQIWGDDTTNVSAISIAMIQRSGGPGFRFFIDDEMLNPSHPPITELANSLGKKPEDIVQDLNNDGWIDLPPGWMAWLPTGQVGDEAFFDRTKWGDYFPFQPDTLYTTLDILCQGTHMQQMLGTTDLEPLTWKSTDPPPHPQLNGSKVMDPVPGIEPISTSQGIYDLVDPDQIWVSPVYKSDIGMAEKDPSKYGSPWASLLGERRSGLIAFIIHEARPKAGGLPEVYIEIIDGTTLDLVAIANDDGTGGGGGIEPTPPRLVW